MNDQTPPPVQPQNQGEDPNPYEHIRRSGSGNIPKGKFAARLTPENVRYLKMISETEDLSLNEALNLILSRQRYYPQDLAEVHEQVTYTLGQLEIIEGQLELCALHEAQLIHLIENGEVEARLQEISDKEEAAVIAASAEPDPTAGRKPASSK